ncbi:hypothetical protein ACJROZ_08090 [Acetobacter indonesiensis]
MSPDANRFSGDLAMRVYAAQEKDEVFMTDTEGTAPAQGTTPEVPDELAKCAMVIESAVEHLIKEQQPPLAIASALLGGSLGLLARSMDKETILRILDSAASSVRSGEVHASTAGENGAQSEKA